MSFSLPGFSNVKREGLILSGSAVLTIPIDLRVGAIEETVTVTGETPVVDVQTVRRETVLDQEVIPRRCRARGRWATCSTPRRA